MVQRVSPGAAIPKDWPRAQDWNDVGEATEDFQRRRRALDAAQHKQWFIQTDWMWLRNDTADRIAGEVLQAGDHLLDTVDPFSPWFAGIAPTHPVDQKTHGVLRTACKSGLIGRVQTSGMVRAWVNVRDTNHRYCDAVDGLHKLQSFWHGPHRIVWKPSGTGNLECWVEMYGSGEVIAEGILAADMCPSILSGSGTEAGDTIEITGGMLFPNKAPFTPNGTTCLVTNPFCHRGPAGSRIKMAQTRVGLIETWEIFDVELRKLCVVNGIEMSWDDNGTSAPEKGCIKYGSVVVGSEWCPSDEPANACRLLDFGPCDSGDVTCDLTWTVLVGSCCEGDDGPGSP